MIKFIHETVIGLSRGMKMSMETGNVEAGAGNGGEIIGG